MSEPFLGEIVLFAGNFAPRNWAFCDGQLLSISSNTALFSILGTTYGGDGRTTFALPDLRGRVPVHPGTGPGLGNVRLGARSGIENTVHTVSTTLSPVDEPHTHELAGGTTGAGVTSTSVATSGNVSAASSFAPTTDNHQPYLGINFIIAINGVFPST